MNREQLQKKLDQIGVPRDFYYLKGFDINYCFTEGYVLDYTSNIWESYLMGERGSKTDVRQFDNEDESCEFFYSKVRVEWEYSKTDWRRELPITDFLFKFNRYSFINSWTKLFLYKWRIYPVFTNLDSFISYINRRFSSITVLWEENKYRIINNEHVIIIHNQNGKWYVVNMINNSIYGHAIIDGVKEMCAATCYYLLNYDDYLKLYYRNRRE